MQIIKGFLLSYVKYGDSDAILHCFTEEAGFQSFFAKGLYTAKNKKKPYLFPLNYLFFSVPKKAVESRISRVSKLEAGTDSYDFQNVAASSVLFFTADFLHQVLREEGRNEVLFEEMIIVRNQFVEQNFDAYLAFIFKFLMISGVAPLKGNDKFLNPESGIFEAEMSHSFFNENISEIWLKFLAASEIYAVKLSKKDKTAFLDSLMIYCQFHITNFYIPNSLAVVREIFE
ncbi:DNA replication and repair protein RecO [Kaistella treverensis]|uniref:DNA replication and repair protein RecO n=1 Tax=Kaistella treverensis TaxID=631455 RepID=A0A1I3KTA3_9FLAO|nr:recombination protein O N-terminal domain-containing protein [Kaistella treverensis]SFI75614.1 DNA replication and repair protein RecO [Kaistella treverensis]